MLCLPSVGLFNVSISTDAECRKQQCGLQITDVLLVKEVKEVLLGPNANPVLSQPQPLYISRRLQTFQGLVIVDHFI